MTTKEEKELEGQNQMLCMKKIDNESSSPLLDEDQDEEMTKSALAEFRAKEHQIETSKTAVREKVDARIGRVQLEAKRLLQIRGVSINIYIQRLAFVSFQNNN